MNEQVIRVIVDDPFPTVVRAAAYNQLYQLRLQWKVRLRVPHPERVETNGIQLIAKSLGPHDIIDTKGGRGIEPHLVFRTEQVHWPLAVQARDYSPERRSSHVALVIVCLQDGDMTFVAPTDGV